MGMELRTHFSWELWALKVQARVVVPGTTCRISDMLSAAASPISAIAVFIPNQIMTYSEDELTAGHTQALTRTFHPAWPGAQ